ncbi:MAG TPA: hypothetical protein VHQ65_08165 [Thermoanaerobaculia bacterium]|nr:hypothetical protein [Thermoanaerobaculia bacterium]
MIRRLLWIFAGLGAAVAVGALLQRRGALPPAAVGEVPDTSPGGGPARAAEPVASPASEAEPADEPIQCAGITRSGERCSRQADPGSGFCWQHRAD